MLLLCNKHGLSIKPYQQYMPYNIQVVNANCTATLMRHANWQPRLLVLDPRGGALLHGATTFTLDGSSKLHVACSCTCMGYGTCMRTVPTSTCLGYASCMAHRADVHMQALHIALQPGPTSM